MPNKSPSRFLRLALGCSALTGLLVGRLCAEPSVKNAEPAKTASALHLSLTEANHDRAKGRLALTVRVQTADFEAALSERAGHKISVADAGEFAPLALEYVREIFRLKSPRGEALRLEWAGLDLTSTQVFMFFETSLTGGLQGVRVENTLLQERIADQINSVELHDGALKQTIVFARGTGEVVVELKP